VKNVGIQKCQLWRHFVLSVVVGFLSGPMIVGSQLVDGNIMGKNK
jgi:hypothetical protein